MKLARRSLLAALLCTRAPVALIGSERRALAAAPPPDVADAAAESKLLALIPTMASGAPATNATIAPALAAEIEAATEALEASFGARDLAVATNLNGSWRLLYSNGREITSLAAGLPGGFALGPTYQPLDTATARFENQGSVLSPFARLSTTVVGDVRPAPAGSLNAAGVRNDRNNRVDVEFRRIVFSLDEVLGRPVALRKVLRPNLKAGVEQPANDQTFLSDTARVVRGGDGTRFLLPDVSSGVSSDCHRATSLTIECPRSPSLALAHHSLAHACAQARFSSSVERRRRGRCSASVSATPSTGTPAPSTSPPAPAARRTRRRPSSSVCCASRETERGAGAYARANPPLHRRPD